jgi:deoxyribodipyrimidine photo-lyase
MPKDSERSIVWFRNDLRLHDHEPLSRAIATSHTLLPLYCVDPRQFQTTTFGFAKTGAFRAQFILEAIADLRASLRAIGSDLIVRVGQPEVIIPQLVQQFQMTRLFYHQEVATEERAVEAALTQALAPLAIQPQTVWGHTLHRPDQLPWPIQKLPELFTQFRKDVEARSEISAPLPRPDRAPSLPPDLDPGPLPMLADLGLTPPSPSPRSQITFTGGETAGLQRVNDYIWRADRLRVYKQTRNGMLHPNDSSKLSPWLALGCLSPRFIYTEVQAYEQQVIANDSTYWLIFELLWRDYFRWIAAKHGHRIFRISGLQGLTLPWQQNWEWFERWRNGQTGYPLVDANMRELQETGFMSNRGRQNVASFLTKNLGIDWRMGAEWFESCLIDYDVCSNWGNWNYTAGIGNDARGFRFFNILKQAHDYDPQGDYVKHWLPELAQIPAAKVHAPWKLLPIEQTRWGLQLDRDYPRPLVDLFESAAANEALYNRAAGLQPPSPRRDRPRRQRR